MFFCTLCMCIFCCCSIFSCFCQKEEIFKREETVREEIRPAGQICVSFGKHTYGIRKSDIIFDPTILGTINQTKYLLDSHFGLNFSFQNFYMKHMNLLSKDVGHVNISTPLFAYELFGFLPHTEVYTTQGHISLTVFAAYKAQCQLRLFFTVLDKDHITSMPGKKIGNMASETQLFFSVAEVVYYRLHYQTEKHFQVALTCNMAATVHDGPGTLSESLKPIFKPDGVQYRTSSFQCVIILWVNVSLRKVPHFHFSSKFINVTQKQDRTFPIESMQLDYPSLSCHSGLIVCLIEINTTTEHDFNISIQYFTYNGSSEHSCRKAGVFVLDYFLKLKRAQHEVCFIQEGHTYRPMYLKSAVLWLGFYSIKEYAHLNISLTVSTHNCAVLTFNSCRFNLYPSIFDASDTKLKQHVSSDCLADTKPHCTKSVLPHFTVNIQENHCVVVQLTHDAKQYQRVFADVDLLFWSFPGNHFSLAMCIIRNMKPEAKLGTRVNYKISGFLSGKLLHFCLVFSRASKQWNDNFRSKYCALSLVIAFNL